MKLLLIYALVMIGIALADWRRTTDFSTYVVAGRRQSAFMVGVSILATCIGASATMGVVDMAADIGTPAFWWLGVGAVGLFFQSLLLAGKLRRYEVNTLPHLVRRLLGPRAALLCSGIIVLAWTGIVAAQFVAAARIVTTLTGWSFAVSLSGAAVLITAYAALGGQLSVMKTDVLQFVVLAAGLLLTAGFLAAGSGLPAGGGRLQLVNEAFPVSRLGYFLVVVGGGYLVCPLLFSRLFAARDERAARRGAFLGCAGLVVMSAVITFIGLCAAGMGDGDALVTVIMAQLPRGVGVVLIFALLSAIVSSTDTCLLAVASIVEHDVLRRTELRGVRLWVLVVGGCGLLLAGKNQDIIGLLIGANAVFTAGMVCPVAVAVLSDGHRRMHRGLACLAVLAGGALGVAANVSGREWLAVAGAAVSLGCSLAALLPGLAMAEEGGEENLDDEPGYRRGQSCGTV